MVLLLIRNSVIGIARELHAQDERRQREHAAAEARLAQLHKNVLAEEAAAEALKRTDRQIAYQYYLRALAGEACADPMRMAAAAENDEIIPVQLPPDVPSHTPGESLSGCQIFLLDEFDAARREGRSFSSADLARRAAIYKRDHPSLAKRIAGTFYSLSEALGGLRKSLQNSSPSDDDSENRPDNRHDVERPERESPQPARNRECFDTYVQELNQTIHACTLESAAAP